MAGKLTWQDAVSMGLTAEQLALLDKQGVISRPKVKRKVLTAKTDKWAGWIGGQCGSSRMFFREVDLPAIKAAIAEYEAE